MRCSYVFVILVVGLINIRANAINSPSLPLPEINHQSIKLENWPAKRPISNSIRAWHYNPQMVQPLSNLGKSIIPNLPFDRALFSKMLAVIASRNQCLYWLCSAVRGLHLKGINSDEIAWLQRNLDKISVSSKDKALLVLAEKLTIKPGDSPKYVKRALKAGWNNQEVASAIFVISYFNMMTRIADAFNLPPDKAHPYDPKSKIPMLVCQ